MEGIVLKGLKKWLAMINIFSKDNKIFYSSDNYNWDKIYYCLKKLDIISFFSGFYLSILYKS